MCAIIVVYIYIYIYTYIVTLYIYVCIYIYIYTHIHRPLRPGGRAAAALPGRGGYVIASSISVLIIIVYH